MFRIVRIIVTMTLVAWGGIAVAQCELPQELSHRVEVLDGDLLVSFGCSHSTIQLGETVDFQLIITNTSADPVTIEWPVSQPQRISVYPVTVADPLHTTDVPVFLEPAWLFYIPGEMTLAPGECTVFSTTWDTAEGPSTQGDFVAWGGLIHFWVNDPSEMAWITPPAGASLDLSVVSAVSTQETSMAGVKLLYR